MKQKIVAALLFSSLIAGIGFLPSIAEAGKSTYIYTDRLFQYVKLVEVDEDDIKDRKVNQPFTFTDSQLRDILAGIRFDKKLLTTKDVQEEDLFNQANLDLLVPHLVKAFEQAKPNEEVAFAFVTHKVQLLIRDDRLTIIRAWVEGDQLHLDFKKLMAKLSNDYDKKMSDVNQAMNRAQGIRVSLALTPGQQYGKTTNEVLLAINHAPAAPTNQAVAQTQNSDKKIAPTAVAVPVKDQVVQTPKPAATTSMTATATAPATSAEGRLQQLETLKKKGLINSDEYQKKREAILNSL